MGFVLGEFRVWGSFACLGALGESYMARVRWELEELGFVYLGVWEDFLESRG